MRIARDGSFSVILSSEQLASGLRPMESSPRNSPFMVELVGMVGRDKVLQTLETIELLDTSIITDGFPYPQLFILANHIFVCGQTKIYELVGSTLTLRQTATLAGSTWRVLDYINYVVFSNGSVTITRNPQTGLYYQDASLPTFHAACDFNGQAFLGNVNG